MNEIFLTTELPSGKKIAVHNGTGFHYFRASAKSDGNTMLMLKYLVIELVYLEGNQITEEQLDNMDISDVVAITDIIAAMLQPVNKQY